MNKIYISGAITKNKNYQKDFRDAELLLFQKYPYSKILNPVKFCSDIKAGSNWFVYMRRCIKVLKTANKIYLINGWKKSKGARVEFALAKMWGVEIVG